MNVTNLNLGKDQEVQIHYQVHINTETQDFQPEHWYQMNGRTTLTPRGDEQDTKVDFGIPSAKAPGIKLTINKVWNNLPGVKPPEKVNFQVSRKNTAATNSWTNATGELTASDN